MQYLIGYDITDDKRLQRIHRRMINFATPIQYSVFLFDRSEEEWSFLFHLPLIEIENKEWFEDFFSMLKIYCK